MMLADLHGLMCEFLLVEDDIRVLMSWLCQMSSNGMVFMASFLKLLFINHLAFTWMLAMLHFLLIKSLYNFYSTNINILSVILLAYRLISLNVLRDSLSVLSKGVYRKRS